MGEAKRRGTYEERVAQAIERKRLENIALQEKLAATRKAEQERIAAEEASMTEEQLNAKWNREQRRRRGSFGNSRSLIALLHFQPQQLLLLFRKLKCQQLVK